MRDIGYLKEIFKLGEGVDIEQSRLEKPKQIGGVSVNFAFAVILRKSSGAQETWFAGQITENGQAGPWTLEKRGPPSRSKIINPCSHLLHTGRVTQALTSDSGTGFCNDARTLVERLTSDKVTVARRENEIIGAGCDYVLVPNVRNMLTRKRNIKKRT